MSKRIFLSPPWMGGSERALVDEAFASNYIAPCGPMVDRFEREFAEAVGLPHACAVSSGTAALDLLFHELKIAAGDTVFCSDLTFVASIAPAVHRGAVPVFIDCDAATWTMDPDLLEEALADAAKAGRLPKGVVAADLYGQCCDYERIEAACAKYGVPLIIDAAEALGARYYGRAGAMQTGFLPPAADGGNASKIQVCPAPARPALVGSGECGAMQTGFLPPAADGGNAS
ncbi:MAG: DegT/DnrJ/EryC1/StrS aminotransferase family protein, partial [bacterium]